MKQILLLGILLISAFVSVAQLPKAQQDEMKQVIAELKKEITTLETEIKQAEKNDPESVPSLKTQLNTYKTMLAALDKSNAASAKPKSTVPAVKSKLPQAPSPIVKVHLKAPVVAPASAQAKDHLFWYKGKKINDSTLVTTKKTVVQYSRKRQMLIVEPDEKKDSFVSVAKRIAKGEQAKRELIDQFDKTKNGFIYYPYLVNSLTLYDDFTKRLSEAVNNTISFKEPLPDRGSPRSGSNAARSGKGPNSFELTRFVAEEFLDSVPGLEQEILKQLGDAERKMKQLPSIENFPAPPRHEIGRCASCDVQAVERQRQLDSIWIEQYMGKEREIMAQVFSAAHTSAVLIGGEADNTIQERVMSIALSMLRRGTQKNRILYERYGDEIHYLTVVMQVILGHERQLQLLGAGETSEFDNISGLMENLYSVYKKYYDEQVAAKNHDFVLNVPFHIGVYRQLALLGAEEKASSVSQYIEEMLAYNRFALTIEMDFVWQRDADGKLQRRATGTMATPKDKVYIWLFPDSCGYRIMAHGTDLNNKKWQDITVPMKVNAGIKTVREENDRLKDYPYTGAPEYAFRFPDSKINFCDNGPDTLFLSMMAGGEDVAARAQGDLQNLHKTYTIEMLIYAMQALINEDGNEMMEGTQDAGNQIMNTIAGFMQQAPPENTLDKLKTEYTGYMEMDNQRKLFENSVATKSARIVFNAANRSTVLTDTYLDTKRKMEDNVEIKKGMFHLRMVHEPKGR